MRGDNIVKCEPSSDEKNNDSQQAQDFSNDQKHSDGLEELSPLAPAAPSATLVSVKPEASEPPPTTTLETLEPAIHVHYQNSTPLDRYNMTILDTEASSFDFLPLLLLKDEPVSEGELQQNSGEDTSDSCSQPEFPRHSPKSWTQHDMDKALEALRKHNMSLTKASATYGIPSTTLWQRAHRLGIRTPKRDAATKSWRDADLSAALHALRTGTSSANKASKAFGIPSSTLYKIARREGIRLAAPFNAAPTRWRRSDLPRALLAIRHGRVSVQRASALYGIPAGTLYGRCKREGIELSRSNPTPWSEDAMGEALEAVRVGQMSINQAAIHFNLPYSSLYGRFKRCRLSVQDSQGYPIHNIQENNSEHQNTVQDLSYNLSTTQQIPNEGLPNFSYYIEHISHNSYDQSYAEQAIYYTNTVAS